MILFFLGTDAAKNQQIFTAASSLTHVETVFVRAATSEISRQLLIQLKPDIVIMDANIHFEEEFLRSCRDEGLVQILILVMPGEENLPDWLGNPEVMYMVIPLDEGQFVTAVNRILTAIEKRDG